MDIPPVVLDGVQELITIGVGRAAGMLNQLTGAHVTLSVPEVRIEETSHECLQILSEDRSSQIRLNYAGMLSGSTILVIPHASALHLVTILTGEEQTLAEMDALRVETLLEVGNIIISALMASFSTLLNTRLSFDFPMYYSGSTGSIMHTTPCHQGDIGIVAQITFEVQKRRIEGDLLLLLTRDSGRQIKNRILTLTRGDD